MDATTSCPVCGWTLDADGRCASCNAVRPASRGRTAARVAGSVVPCPRCGVTLPPDRAACPECGARLVEPSARMAPIARIVAVGAAAALILMIVDLVKAALGG